MHLPAVVFEPFRLIGGAAVPLMLMGFGMSLHGQRVLEPGSGRRDVVLATGLKLLAMPLAAWVARRDPCSTSTRARCTPP